MPTIPPELAGQRYISLTTFRKNGTPVATPIWFSEMNGKLYVMTRSDSWKYKRVRNDPRVKVAPCSVRGKIKGPTFDGSARIVPEGQRPVVRQSIEAKYWLARVSFLWRKVDAYLEIEVA